MLLISDDIVFDFAFFTYAPFSGTRLGRRTRVYYAEIVYGAEGSLVLFIKQDGG